MNTSRIMCQKQDDMLGTHNTSLADWNLRDKFLKEPYWSHISSLYPNIPNHEGLVAVADHLRRDPEKHQKNPFILKLLKLVLHSMNFNFNGDLYLQVGGNATGTAVAPHYGNLFMDRFQSTKKLATKTTYLAMVYWWYLYNLVSWRG